MSTDSVEFLSAKDFLAPTSGPCMQDLFPRELYAQVKPFPEEFRVSSFLCFASWFQSDADSVQKP